MSALPAEIGVDFSLAWKDADVPMHVDLTFMSTHGAVFHSITTKTIVLRFQSAKSLSGMLDLAELALTETEALRAELLICDMRPLGADAARMTCSAILLHLLRCGKLKGLALLTAAPDHHLLSPEVHGAIAQTSIAWFVAQSAEAVATWFAEKSEDMLLWLKARADNFVACYAGSTFSLPDLRCTVLRSAGNIVDRDMVTAMVAQAQAYHAAARDDAFIIDTSSSPQITEASRYSYTFKTVILPLCTSGLVRYWFHVRSGDQLITHDAPPLEPLLRSFNIQYFEVETMGEALKVLTSLRGHGPA